MPFSSCTLVAGLIPNLLSGASDIENTCDIKLRPASATIVKFMSSGCALITAKLNSMGFSAPAEGGALYDFLADIEANYVAWRCELSRSSPRTAKGERSRADDFRKAYEANLRQLADMDLTLMGFTPMKDTGSGWYVSGISKSEKSSVESNTDRVPAKFTRDGFRNPSRPSETNNDDQAG